jgi:DNA-binding LacI/PurR family transcriptional regulator
MNGSGYVSAEKGESIAKAVKMLDYKPSSVARALASNQSKSIGVIASDVSLFGSVQLIEGIEQEAMKRGYLVSIVLEGDAEQSREAINSLVRSMPYGCILFDFNQLSNLHSLVPYVSGLIPTAVINEGITGTSDLALGAFEGGYEITRYLLSLGHKTVHHVSIPENGNKYTRYFGWKKALEDAGAPIPDALSTTWDPRSAESIGKYLASDPSVTAIFAGNDEVAAGIIRGLSKEGKRVPEDVSVAGFDGNPISAIMLPSITTWMQNFQEMGRRAVARLLDGGADLERSSQTPDNDEEAVQAFMHKIAERTGIPEKLVVRESTAQPRSL